jgi:SAM-dependent methyltransferase
MKTNNDIRYKDNLFINKYIALWAYGYINGFGEAEGLYSCITRMCTQLKDFPKKILDIGCGIGRTSFDLAQLYPNAEILGIDQSVEMIKFAQLINTGYFKDRLIDINDISMHSLKAPIFSFENVNFMPISFEKYSKKYVDQKFDLITNVNYLDRCLDMNDNIRLIHRFLNDGGYVIGSTPLNFRNYSKVISKYELKQSFESIGFKCELYYDDVIYREILDQRKAVEEYKVVCFKMRKI